MSVNNIWDINNCFDVSYAKFLFHFATCDMTYNQKFLVVRMDLVQVRKDGNKAKACVISVNHW